MEYMYKDPIQDLLSARDNSRVCFILNTLLTSAKKCLQEKIESWFVLLNLVLQDLNNKSSLQSYRHFKLHSFRENYTNDVSNFRGIQLKFKARCGALELESLIEKWGKSDGMCKLCKNGKETVCHFMFHCCTLNDIRMQVFQCLESKLINTEYAHVWHSFCASSTVHKLNMCVGEFAYMYGEDIGVCFDQLCKVYLTSAWDERQRLLSSARNWDFHVSCGCGVQLRRVCSVRPCSISSDNGVWCTVPLGISLWYQHHLCT